MYNKYIISIIANWLPIFKNGLFYLLQYNNVVRLAVMVVL